MTSLTPKDGCKSIRAPSRGIVSTLALTASLLMATSAAATDTDNWRESSPQKTISVDHSPWTDLVSRYIETDKSGVNRFRYADVSDKNSKVLANYIRTLEDLDPRKLTKSQQEAYWINLYNAATVNLILKNYPVDSIRDIGGSLFSSGPWDDQAVTVTGEPLTLNDIEHKILRPIWHDPRIHYAVNCASYSCPNLAKKAYTANHIDDMLNAGAKAYINNKRGVSFEDDDLRLSSIYKWYQEDFGNSEQGVIKHLEKYASPELKQKLTNFDGDINYHYNWQLNAPK